MCTRNEVESMKGEHEGDQGDRKCAGQGDANPVGTLGEQGAYAYRVEHIMGEAHLWVQQRGRASVDTCTAWGQHLCVQPREAAPLYAAWGQHDSVMAMESELEARQVDSMDSVH